MDMNGQLLKPINLLLACLLVLPLLASASTLERVRSSNSLTLGYLPDISSQQGGQPSGYAIELCEQVAAHIKSELGLADLQVRYQTVDEAESIAAVSSGSIDILCSPTLETLRERRVVSFSLPIYTAGLAALVREDASPALINVLNGKVAHSHKPRSGQSHLCGNRGRCNRSLGASAAESAGGGCHSGDGRQPGAGRATGGGWQGRCVLF
jgi:polar amino acid transport system substrate-binding protein